MILCLMGRFIYRLKEQPWVKGLPQSMLTFLWPVGRRKCLRNVQRNQHIIYVIWTIFGESGRDPQRILKSLLGFCIPTMHLFNKTDFNKETIDFLDTTVFKGPDFHTTGKLDVKVYFKIHMPYFIRLIFIHHIHLEALSSHSCLDLREYTQEKRILEKQYLPCLRLCGIEAIPEPS